MRESKKIAVLQKMIDRLQLDNHQLENENKQLREQLEVDRDKCKEKENQLGICIEEYQKLIKENKSIRDENIAELNNLKQLKRKYNKKMNKVIKSTKRLF